MHFHFSSKSAIKNALELVLGPFTSNPQQVKKKILGGTGKFQDLPPGNFQDPTSDSLPPGKFQDFPPWKIPGPNQSQGLGYF